MLRFFCAAHKCLRNTPGMRLRGACSGFYAKHPVPDCTHRGGETIFHCMEKRARDYLALALDNCVRTESIRGLIRDTREHIGIYKIGLEQFTRFGPGVLEHIRSAQRRIFLDLKLHDIPNTVGKAVAAAASHEVDFLTVHTQGGMAMLQAAADAASRAARPPRLVGVTVLTSIDERALREELLVGRAPGDHVRHLAGLAARAGLDGIVCSAADLGAVRGGLPDTFEIITPGIRMPDSNADDQKRVATPESAIAAGATILVVGRPITAAPDPRLAAQRFEQSIAGALKHGPLAR
ncbi:MAG: orotidine-5'-phosphate decarboxylase [Chitinivibrionales bacterium]|nr:orotidine-5'-phosphate decarboxylase [Chitinivibrionales bacterium]MBD3394925.1 orotidine-5'-phosphate decarboxylase [Chitinivibrionales bacterium]